MDVESNSAPIVTKKLWSKVKVVLYMVRKIMAKTKLLVDLHIKLKNGKLARKAFMTLLHHHYDAFACRCTSNNIDMSPQEHVTDSRYLSHHDFDLQQVVIKALDGGGGGGGAIEPSPLVVVSHEVKVADSPLHTEEESQVDKAAEEFIKKFYRQLNQQRMFFSAAPSSPDRLWAQ